MNLELSRLCSELSKFVVGTEGNVSQRTADGFMIKQSGTSFRHPWFVGCTPDGNPLPGEKGNSSMEASFHVLIYQRSDYRFIAHTHPTNTLKILCTDKIYDFARKRLFPDQVVFNGAESYVIPYATPGKDLTQEMERWLCGDDPIPSLFLLANHGIICCGYSVQQVVTMTEICEKAAEIFLSSDELRFLMEEEVLAIQRHPDEVYRNDHSR